jgi:hypothetical protein
MSLNKSELLQFLDLNIDDDVAAEDFILQMRNAANSGVLVLGVTTAKAATAFNITLLLQAAALAHDKPCGLLTKEEVLKVNRLVVKQLMDDFDNMKTAI